MALMMRALARTSWLRCGSCAWVTKVASPHAFAADATSCTHGLVSSQRLCPLSSMDSCARLYSAQSGTEFTVSIDRSGLKEHVHGESAEKSKETPLERHIKSLIRFRGGPITVAEYMSEVLTNPVAGFYMHRDVFGREGDFITSPDISQMFGEMVGVWSTCLWQQMGEPDQVNLIELGPGRGTLMADFLRGTAKFKEFSKALSLHLVECSPTLRKLQYETLRCKSDGKEQAVASSSPWAADKTVMTTTTESGPAGGSVSAVSQPSGTPVSWYLDLDQVPTGVPSIIIAHEFLDALPIHQFQKTARGWREKLVDVSEGSEVGLRFVLSPDPTPALSMYLAPRLKWASVAERENLTQVEVCPQAMKLACDISQRIGKDGGGALILDYGKNQIVTDSLQAIRKHQFVNVFQDPGAADLSAFVDFAAVKHMVDSRAQASAFGPISQSQFLGMLGINFRLESLLKNASEEQAEALQLGYWRLVGDGEPPWLEQEGTDSLPTVTGMGSQYLALAIVNNALGAPAGFQ